MSKLKLYHSPTSPFVRKVMIVLKETGQDGDVTTQFCSGNPLDAGTMPVADNPLGKIPCLVTDAGQSIFDSRIITAYLNARAKDALSPAGVDRFQSMTLEALADGMMDAAVVIVYEMRVRPAEKRSDDWIEGHWAKIDRALDALENTWIAHLNGPLDIGQIAVASALGYLDFRHDARGWRSNRPALAAWLDVFAKRSSFATTIPAA